MGRIELVSGVGGRCLRYALAFEDRAPPHGPAINSSHRAAWLPLDFRSRLYRGGSGHFRHQGATPLTAFSPVEGLHVHAIVGYACLSWNRGGSFFAQGAPFRLSGGPMVYPALTVGMSRALRWARRLRLGRCG